MLNIALFLMLLVGLDPLGVISDDEFCSNQGIRKIKLFVSYKAALNIQFNFFILVSDDGNNYPFPYREESERYQVFYEKIQNIQLIGYEIREFFDGLKNIGIAVSSNLDIQFTMYAYYDYNELVIIEGLLSFSLFYFLRFQFYSQFSILNLLFLFHFQTKHVL